MRWQSKQFQVESKRRFQEHGQDSVCTEKELQKTKDILDTGT